MRLTRFAAIALSASALVAVSAPFAAHAATEHPAAHDTLAAATPSVAVYSCTNQPQVRPSTYDQFCDGSGYFTGLHWSTWNASIAAATGGLRSNAIPTTYAVNGTRRSCNNLSRRHAPTRAPYS